MNFSEVDDSDKLQMNDIYYNFPAHDGLFFEIQSVHKSLLYFQDLFVTDNASNIHGKRAVEDRERKVLNIMLLSKVIHYLETLGAVALSIISTKSKRSFERLNKSEEKEKFVNYLSSYNVGDVVNFYQEIGKRRDSYLYSFIGFPPAVFQTDEINSFLSECCKNIVTYLKEMGTYYTNHIDFYNAYKHGYRIVIPDFIDATKNGFVLIKEDNEPVICTFDYKEIDLLLKYSKWCNEILTIIYENNKESMYVLSNKKVKLNGRVLMDKKSYSSHLEKTNGIVLNYPTTNEEKDLLKKGQDNVLRNIEDLEKYRHQWVIVDLDEEKITGSASNIHEIAILDRKINPSNRKTSLRITDAKLNEIANNDIQTGS
jgi:hypothetical protein